MRTPKILAMVLAGGEGTRLHPLTAERSKPAVPFGGRYRIVDFVLSNLVNSKIFSIYLLVQYKSQSLIEHIRRAWVLSPIIQENFVTVVPPQMREGQEWFQGTADAVSQNLNLIELHQPDLVAVFGADHIYRMDVRQMVAFHFEHGAHASVAALPVPRGQASAFGIIDAADDGRVRGFLEKPKQPPPMPGNPDFAYASMGNYLFETGFLVEALLEARRLGENDFGRHIIPRAIDTHRVYAYDFAKNRVPMVRDYEEQAYWRDVGSIDAFFDANMDTLGAEPRLDLFNPAWRIGSSNYQGPSSHIIGAQIEDSTVGAGCILRGAKLRRSVVRREVVLEEGVELDECVIMDYANIGRGAKLRRVIVDRHNVVEPGARIGFDAAADRERWHVSEGGVVVIPKAMGGYTVAATA